jgi:hypothetical protein
VPSNRPTLAPLLLGALALSGCGLFHRAPQPLPVLIPQPPIVFPAPPPTPMPPPTSYAVMDAAPDFSFAVALGPAPRPAPRRAPEVVAATPPAVPPESAPPPPLTPALTPQQQAAVRGQALAVLERARNDLRLLAGRRLFGSAAATRAQAGEYVRQAEQALQEGDAMRAQTLAAKAETLARFLLGQ